MPVLRASLPIAPGARVTVPAVLRNDDRGPIELEFVCGDLVSDSGERIPSHCITIAPSHLRLAPTSDAHLVIDLEVPTHAQPGVYRAELRSTTVADVCAVVMVTIARSGDGGRREPR
jgi:hypothetical protein